MRRSAVQSVLPRRRLTAAVDELLRPLAGPLLRAHSAWARRQGLRRPVVILSLDCDTDRDIEVAADVHERLQSLGITPVYAVAAELLEAGANVFVAIARSGAEFMNHGYRRHCELDRPTRTYVSTGFYDRMTVAEVAADVTRGHDGVLDVLGRAPRGFRTPHFGTFRHRHQLASLYRTLEGLNYRYSSSTMPLPGYLRGPVVKTAGGLVELAVSGCPGNPRRVLDSWSFRFAPGRRGREGEYVAEFGKLRRFFVEAQRPGLMNLYADPSQIEDWPEFFELMASVAHASLPSYSHLLEELKP